MRGSVVVFVVAVLLSPWAMHAVSGQGAMPSTATPLPASGTPTPTPLSPTSTAVPIPDGRALLELMKQAMTRRGSVWVDSEASSTWTGHRVVSFTQLDMSIRSNTVRELDTIKRVRLNVSPIKITVERRELLFAHGIAATRKPHGAWFCERLRGVKVRDSLIAFQLESRTLTNLGAVQSNGVDVWHVRATGAEVAAWATRSATVDLYIARADTTLVRLTLRAVTLLGGRRVHEVVTEEYSDYGESVNVKLPSPCH